MKKFQLVLGMSVAGFGLLVPSLAQAHFQLVAPQSWWTQLSDGSPQKTAPCGDEMTTGTSATKMVTTVQPGQSVPVQVSATVSHPGWYRISLKQGASASQTIASFPDPPTLGAAGSAQQCTPAFIDNPVWSPTQPVLADKLGLPAGSTSTTTVQSGMKTFNVTIPATATCTAASPCTLQVLMFMTDHPSGSCNYHHCADIAVQTGATGGGGHGGGAAGSSGGAKGGAAGSTATGTGGATATGGVPGTGGGAGESAGTGGTPITGTGGALATGGTHGTGGTNASGGSASGGSTGAAGATGATGNEGSSGGCAYAAGGKTASKLGIGIVLLLAVAFARRRRRARRG
ncbi:MAG: SCE4755 family polysaccharide monooxygenase-like protein [Pseudomonadota bacterium]